MEEIKTFTQIRTLFGIEEDCGFTEAEMQPFFGVVKQMPALLYDYYTTLGKHQALNQTQDCLVTPKSNLALFNNPNYFVFYAENQNCCLWAIAKGDLGEETPKVYVSYDQKEWQVECDTLSNFCWLWLTCRRYLLCLILMKDLNSLLPKIWML